MPDTAAASLNSLDARKETCVRIKRYMEEHLHEPLTLQDICRDNLIGSSQLSRMFREFYHCGAID